MFPALPEPLLAARLLEEARDAGPPGAAFLARSETRAARLCRAATALAGEAAEVLLLPGWDCLPYDRASPSRAVTGARLMVAAALEAPAAASRPRLLIASVEAAMQRLPPAAARERLRLAEGEPLDPEALEAALYRLGYALDDRVDMPGEAALRGAVVDIFPVGTATALRIRHEEGQIVELLRYDPATQRSLEQVREVELPPASELVLTESEEITRRPGIEHGLGELRKGLLRAPVELLPRGARILLDAEAEAARTRRLEEVQEAFRTRVSLRSAEAADARRLSTPEALHLDDAAWARMLEGREVSILEAAEPEEMPEPPDFLAEEDPDEAFCEAAEAVLERRGRLVLAGSGRGADALAQLLAERLGQEPQRLSGWLALEKLPAGGFGRLDAAPDEGFEDGDTLLVPVTAVRRRAASPGAVRDAAAIAGAMPALQPGDAVIHMEHGLGALSGVEPVDTGAGRIDCLRIDYADDASRLVPVQEMDLVWHYGTAAESVTLDRLGTDSWSRRRAEAEEQIAATARQLLELARARAESKAMPLRPHRAAMARFADRFPHEPTLDQAAAIAATLSDMAREQPMDRLVCGDVGFGKTEVALRAVAAAVLCGKQAAVLAPTTVLARQHLETFRRRFAGMGLRIVPLSRLTPPAEAREARRAIASGEAAIAIGTQALAAPSVRFRDLALVVVDEEQRFGTRQKAALRRMGQKAGQGAGVHTLTLTATPIPRTLQAAMVGLQELSVIATPPVLRQPVRTLRAPLDDALLTQALRREVGRGGQSFIVCPRIEDIAPMQARVAGLLPELDLLVAHGDMPPAEVDEAMQRFADGEGDALLSTNIVETGLDVPRANTMLVWRADRFGLAQLHQLRGRVGRGRSRGVAYLLTDPEQPRLAPATERRLGTLEALDRVGAGFAIAARDLDLRGAGALLGEEQAGHLRLVGMELYRHMLDRALAAARGESPPEEWTPVLSLGLDAFIPPEHVPEETLRVELHARIGGILREGGLRMLRELAEEAEDRFGPPPAPFANLLALARPALLCRRLGIARLEAGPQAAAADFRGAPPDPPPPPLEASGARRLVLRRPGADAGARLKMAEALLAALLPRRRRRERRAAAAAEISAAG
jgi:transcription-repair coupling factor (superfamily II helicase)